LLGQYTPPKFNVAFVGKCVSTNVTSIGTTYNVTPGYECIIDVYYNVLNTLNVLKLFVVNILSAIV